MPKTIIAAAALAATLAGPADAETLRDLAWKKRVVVVFSETGDARVETQADILRADEKGLAERDLLAFSVVGDTVRPLYGTPPKGETAAGLRKRFSPGAGFTAILIGKDGGEKLRREAPLQEAELFEIIDAMPMRRNGG